MASGGQDWMSSDGEIARLAWNLPVCNFSTDLVSCILQLKRMFTVRLSLNLWSFHIEMQASEFVPNSPVHKIGFYILVSVLEPRTIVNFFSTIQANQL